MGYYDVFRVAADDGTGWQNVHHEAPMSARYTHTAVNPVTGQPVLIHGYDPPKVIERVPPGPGVSVGPTEGLVTTEEGNGADTFAVRLDTEPTASVTIDLSSSDTTASGGSPSTHATFVYDAADNHDPDGDSDGTTIDVSKP